LDGETGAAGDVEVGELTECVLDFEDADEFGVEGEDAGAACEDATADVFEDGEYGVDAVVAELEGRVEVADGFWIGWVRK